MISRCLSITHPIVARKSLCCLRNRLHARHLHTAMYRNSVDMYTSPSVLFSSWATREEHMVGRVTHDGSYPGEAHHERQWPYAIGQFTPAFACPINTQHAQHLVRGIVWQRSPMGALNVRWEAIDSSEGFDSPCQQQYHSPSLLGFPEAMVSVSTKDSELLSLSGIESAPLASPTRRLTGPRSFLQCFSQLVPYRSQDVNIVFLTHNAERMSWTDPEYGRHECESQANADRRLGKSGRDMRSREIHDRCPRSSVI